MARCGQKEHFEETPVVVVVCATRRVPPWPRLMNAGVYVSVYPAMIAIGWPRGR
jgi:hypothetical protein